MVSEWLSMKALMLTWEFPPRIIGGISTHVYNLSRVLARRGVTVCVITCDFPGAKPQEIINGVQVFRVDSSKISQTNFLLWIFYLNSLMIDQASEILERDRFDVIHAHDWLVGRAALELKRRYGTALVTTVHATEIGRGDGVHTSYQMTIHNIEDFLINNSERAICCSNFMVEHVHHNFGIGLQKMDLIPNAVDPMLFTRAPTNSGPGMKMILTTDQQGGKVVLFVGRLVREKGLFTLIDAFEKLREKVNATLVVVGDGPIKEDLIKETCKRRLEKYVRFTGRVDETSLVRLYCSSDAFVLPSTYEPFGIAALEAMASGVPVVVSSSGGLSEIVENGVTGLKVPPGDAKALAVAMRSILEDTDLADRLKKNAYSSLLERYNWDLVAEKTLGTYNRAMTETKRSPALPDKAFLTDLLLTSVLLTLGATKRELAKTAREIAASIMAPEVPVKLVLGRLASQGYVTGLLEAESQTGVTYHLTESGIVKACSWFS